ncbi:MAG: hypothetical protein NVS3B2_03650 [Ramlibacter sp.]
MDLFGDDPAPPTRRREAGASIQVAPAATAQDLLALSKQLPPSVHLGTSSWSFPGWRGFVWRDDHDVSTLSRQGLPAYSSHPLLRCVSLDRSFYRPLAASDYAAYAGQVPADFRFIVKAPSQVCDATVRASGGRRAQDNPAFLDSAIATRDFTRPVTDGLGDRIGALVFQLSPLPDRWLRSQEEFLNRLAAFLAGLRTGTPGMDRVPIAVEVRNAQLLTHAFADVLRAGSAHYCLGLHPRLPPIEEQLPMLRALWPSPLVCRWSLNRKHGSFGYEDAKGQYAPFDRLQDPDPATRNVLARLIAATTGAGLPVYVTVNNKAEGCAPRSVEELARAVAEALEIFHSVD